MGKQGGNSNIRKIGEFFGFRPGEAGYIRAKLQRRFGCKEVFVEKAGEAASFYLKIPHGVTHKDRVNTAKMFGLTLREVKFVKLDGIFWKITFTARGMRGVKNLIGTFPGWVRRMRDDKKFTDYGPEVEAYLTKEQKLKIRKENKRFWEILIDVGDYLFGLPVLGDVLRWLYLNESYFGKIAGYLPKNDDARTLVYGILAWTLLFVFFITFPIWGTIFCLLLAGYGIRKLRGSVRIRTEGR